MKAFIPLILAFLLLFPVYSSAGDPSAVQEPPMDHGPGQPFACASVC